VGVTQVGFAVERVDAAGAARADESLRRMGRGLE
jgi:hypothetical protein